MHVYLRRMYEPESNGKQVSFTKEVATSFFACSDDFLYNGKNIKINVCHVSDPKRFEEIELQPATDYRFSSRLSSFLSENGQTIEVGDVLYIEKMVRSYCVQLIKPSDSLFKPLDSLIKSNDRHYLSFTEGDVDCCVTQPKKAELYNSAFPLQQIVYGAPGTGKSHGTDGKIAEIYPDNAERKKNVFRTTFHPDSDYSTFVGCYKPTMGEAKPIYGFDSVGKTTKVVDNAGNEVMKRELTYTFVPQAFTKAYIRAMQLKDEGKHVFLVVEEINRGNCAQIFGDLFQLLDREDNGWSKYAIKPDSDLEKYLVEMLGDDYDTEEGMKLPPNLLIWATMNTSDQSLFPIDSAFKRRWEWKYVPISKKDVNYKIEVEKEGKLMRYDWWDFLDKVNAAIGNATSSEDKKLGYFFCKADKKVNETDKEPSIITADRFVGKVIFYLWNDVFKDYEIGDAKFTYTYKDGEKKGQTIELSLLGTKEGENEVPRIFSSFFDDWGNAKQEDVVKLLDELQIEGKEVVDSGSEDNDTTAGNFQ